LSDVVGARLSDSVTGERTGLLQAETPGLLLASGSMTRAALLTQAGLAFTARASGVDEASLKASLQAEGSTAVDAATMLADWKARRLSERVPGALVLGCDQLLVCEGAWFDKPDDRASARAQLQRLSGRMHELITAVVAMRGGVRVWQHVATPRLWMRPLKDPFLDVYLDAEGDTVLASVGAYRLEGLGVRLFERIEGEHSAILGLPLLPLLGFLRQHGVLLD